MEMTFRSRKSRDLDFLPPYIWVLFVNVKNI